MTSSHPSSIHATDPQSPDQQSPGRAGAGLVTTRLGAHPLPGGGTRFRVWTTTATDVQVQLDGALHPMTHLGGGAYELALPVGAGARYVFVLDGQERPDPYARFLPGGVHGAAEVIDLAAYPWQHREWRGLALADCVFYELHVGTFTPQGTYRAAQDKLPYLKDLGITAIQLMPVAAFPGERGWGYDGVALYAPFAAYGRPEDLMALVDAAHGLGLAVFLDVVYNHFGPDGNYLPSYSPSYFTERFHSAWGMGLDYAEAHMRRLITGNARMWLRDYHFDGLRLDATASMPDDNPLHILQELAQEVHALGGTHLLLAEDHRNLPELVTEYGLDGIWSDDFHHAMRVTLTGEHEGYYRGYQGGAAEVAQLINRGWKYEGQFWNVPGEEHERGQPADPLEAPSFVYCIQNHDQIGNRASGDRLNHHAHVTPGLYRGASTLLLTLPMTPLLFQGQEWAAGTPFPFFSDHAGELGQLVSEGRRKEFAYFSSFASEHVPDPQAESTFLSAKLDWNEPGLGDPAASEVPPHQEPSHGEHGRTLALYRTLLRLRRDDPVLRERTRRNIGAGNAQSVLWVRWQTDAGERALLWNLGQDALDVDELELPFTRPPRLILHSETGLSATLPAPGRLGPGETALYGTP